MSSRWSTPLCKQREGDVDYRGEAMPSDNRCNRMDLSEVYQSKTVINPQNKHLIVLKNGKGKNLKNLLLSIQTVAFPSNGAIVSSSD